MTWPSPAPSRIKGGGIAAGVVGRQAGACPDTCKAQLEGAGAASLREGSFIPPGSWKSISRFFWFQEEVRSLDNGVLILTDSKNSLGKTSEIIAGFRPSVPAWKAGVRTLLTAEHKHFCSWKNL